jgi:hypothetical protein
MPITARAMPMLADAITRCLLPEECTGVFIGLIKRLSLDAASVFQSHDAMTQPCFPHA